MQRNEDGNNSVWKGHWNCATITQFNKTATQKHGGSEMASEYKQAHTIVTLCGCALRFLKPSCQIDVCSNYLQQLLMPVLTRETQSGLQFRNRSFAIILSVFLSDSICTLQLDASIINKSPEENVGEGQTAKFSSVREEVPEEQWQWLRRHP